MKSISKAQPEIRTALFFAIILFFLAPYTTAGKGCSGRAAETGFSPEACTDATAKAKKRLICGKRSKKRRFLQKRLFYLQILFIKLCRKCSGPLYGSLILLSG